MNSDPKMRHARQISAASGIAWRPWYDGRNGPICKLYDVKSFSIAFVLDAKGITRYKYAGAKNGLEQDVEELEPEKGGGWLFEP